MIWPWLFAGACALLLAASAYGAWLLAERRHLTAERHRLADDLDQTRAQLESSRNEAHALEREIAQVNQRLAVAEQTHRNVQQELDKAQQQLREAFRALASEALQQNANQFLTLARKTFEGEQKDAAVQLEQRKQAIESLVKPLKEHLDQYNSSLQQIENARREAYGSLKTQLGALLEDQRKLRDETANLVTALRRPEVRGRWGEMQLRRVAELAGMIEHCDFVEQGSHTAESGRLIPDMVVKLPSNRHVVVDAKTPLDAFLRAIESPDENQRNAYLDQHAQQIQTQVDNLSNKQYSKQFDRSPDFVVLFIPGEGFLYPALQRRPTLLEDAMTCGVVIATPTTLISLLKVIALGWRQEQLAQNAQRISKLGRELHERLCTALEHVERLGSSLEKSVKAYNDLVGSLESRVLSSARKFEEWGAGAPGSLPEQIERIDSAPRQPRLATPLAPDAAE